MEEQAARVPIGAASRRSGVNVETIRYYERIGLMPAALRTASGHRTYDAARIRRLGFIRRARELGFPLDEVRAMLGLVDDGTLTCGEIHGIATARLAGVRGRIADLRRMERALAAMAAECARGDRPDCPIIETLFAGGD